MSNLINDAILDNIADDVFEIFDAKAYDVIDAIMKNLVMRMYLTVKTMMIYAIDTYQFEI